MGVVIYLPFTSRTLSNLLQSIPPANRDVDKQIQKRHFRDRNAFESECFCLGAISATSEAMYPSKQNKIARGLHPLHRQCYLLDMSIFPDAILNCIQSANGLFSAEKRSFGYEIFKVTRT
jgi:hypothetical protein